MPIMSTSLPNGQFVTCSLMAIDVAGHSKIVLSLSIQKTRDLFTDIERCVRKQVELHKGKLLNWQGDGGMAVFYTRNATKDEARAKAALDSAEAIFKQIPKISLKYKLRNLNALQVRLATHSGTLIWRKNTGSIHSADVNFVAHLEHFLPNGAIGVSESIERALPGELRKFCASVGKFEEREVFIYARNPAARKRLVALYEQRQTVSEISKRCMEVGLVDLEFRDYHHKKLPPASIYAHAKKEIFMSGITLAASLKQHDSLKALRAASARGVRIYLLVMHPKNLPPRFRKGVDSIEETRSVLQEELKTGRMLRKSTKLREATSWPHFTGIMIDGDIGRKIEVAAEEKLNTDLILRVQSTIPPDGHKSQHSAPIFQYQSARPSLTMLAYSNGFRHCWRNARPIDLT